MKTCKILAFMLAVALSGASGLVAAQPPPATPGAAAGGGEENVSYKAKTTYDFEDDIVEGDLQRPDGELVNSLRDVKHDSLIEIRHDFIPEMLKSLEDI